MTRRPREITQAVVDRSYELAALLEVCKAAAEQVSEHLETKQQWLVEYAGAVPSVIQQAIDKWADVHDALELAQRDQDKPEPTKPAEPVQTTFDDLFAEWNTNRKQQNTDSDAEAERLNERERELIERIVAYPTRSPGEIAAKLFVAKTLLQQVGSRWSDERDLKVLDSITADLVKLASTD